MTHTNDTTADPFTTFIGAGIILSVIACILTLITAVITAPETTASLGETLLPTDTTTTIYTAENAALCIAKITFGLTIALAAYQLGCLCLSIYKNRPDKTHWSEFVILLLSIIFIVIYHDLIGLLANAHFGPLAEITQTFHGLIIASFILIVTAFFCYICREITNSLIRMLEEK